VLQFLFLFLFFPIFWRCVSSQHHYFL
jgi:hypothetical protein